MTIEDQVASMLKLSPEQLSMSANPFSTSACVMIFMSPDDAERHGRALEKLASEGIVQPMSAQLGLPEAALRVEGDRSIPAGAFSIAIGGAVRWVGSLAEDHDLAGPADWHFVGRTAALAQARADPAWAPLWPILRALEESIFDDPGLLVDALDPRQADEWASEHVPPGLQEEQEHGSWRPLVRALAARRAPIPVPRDLNEWLRLADPFEADLQATYIASRAGQLTVELILGTAAFGWIRSPGPLDPDAPGDVSDLATALVARVGARIKEWSGIPAPAIIVRQPLPTEEATLKLAPNGYEVRINALARARGTVTGDPTQDREYLDRRLTACIVEAVPEAIGMHWVAACLDGLAGTAELRAVVPDCQFACLLSQLVAEGFSPSNLRPVVDLLWEVAEVAGRADPGRLDTAFLLEAVRVALLSTLPLWPDLGSDVGVMALPRDVEEAVASALAADPSRQAAYRIPDTGHFLASLGGAMPGESQTVVLVTASGKTRPAVRRLVAAQFPTLLVLSVAELPAGDRLAFLPFPGLPAAIGSPHPLGDNP